MEETEKSVTDIQKQAKETLNSETGKLEAKMHEVDE